MTEHERREWLSPWVPLGSETMFSRTYTTYQTAKICDVYPSTVINWINGGKLKCYTTPGGHHRITREDLLAFLKQFNIPIPQDLTLSQRRVLIVDDDPEITHLLEKAFKRYPDLFKVETCNSGVEALIRIGQWPPDLMILDIVMPKMDGFQLCKNLKNKQEAQGIKNIVITGKKISLTKSKLEEHGIDTLFKKPMGLISLISKSAELLQVDLPLTPKTKK